MAQQMHTRMSRQANPERWQKAAHRAIAEEIEIRQLADCQLWQRGNRCLRDRSYGQPRSRLRLLGRDPRRSSLQAQSCVLSVDWSSID